MVRRRKKRRNLCSEWLQLALCAARRQSPGALRIEAASDRKRHGLLRGSRPAPNYYAAAATYEQLARLSDAELHCRGLSRATLGRDVCEALDRPGRGTHGRDQQRFGPPGYRQGATPLSSPAAYGSGRALVGALSGRGRHSCPLSACAPTAHAALADPTRTWHPRRLVHGDGRRRPGAGGAFLFALSRRALTWKVLVESAHGERRLACIEPDPRDLLNGPPAH